MVTSIVSSSSAPTENTQRTAGIVSRHPAAAFVLRRVAAGLLTLFVVSILIFLATNILPGNVAQVVLGRNATPATVHKLESELNLDHPIVDRYFLWLDGVAHGNLGKSAVAVAEGSPNPAITSSLESPLEDSLILGGITAALLIPLTLGLGVVAGIFSGRKLDYFISLPSLVAGGLPEFVTGIFLIFIFFTKLNILPPVSLLSPGESPFSNFNALILPVLTLLAVAAGSGIRQVRTGMIGALRSDYVRFARLNGINERRVILRYALRNALAPSVQIIAQNLQYLVGGIIIVESVFSYPGIGTYLVQAVSSRNVTAVQAAALVLATLYIAINIVADLIVVFLVPKLRTEML
jgi:peptide/nickel transport system permease protein